MGATDALVRGGPDRGADRRTRRGDGLVDVARRGRRILMGLSAPSPICGVICECGPFNEPLACGLHDDHAGPHAWASLPTFVDGRPVFTPKDKAGANLDVQIIVTETDARRWRWEVRNLTTAKRTTRFDWETTERKAWIRALAVARAEFGPGEIHA